MNRLMSECEGSDLARSAIVFSPHPDDETLGCGGTIIRKKKAGADVKIVFMTDGSRSHKGLISENELKSIRTSEALAAAQMLGVEPHDVFFLEFKDGELDKNQDAATNKVTQIILRYPPNQIFLPYHKEAPQDHSITNQLVVSALKMCRLNATIYEYPIWFWYHWPWVSLPIGFHRETLSLLKHSLATGFGLSLLCDYRCSVYIGDVLNLKRAALNQHRSQMEKLIPDKNWQTLDSIANGEWLECFFQEYEFFRYYNFLEEE
jgi:LmbE family N-acetylglucosaminyl deacetylase